MPKASELKPHKRCNMMLLDQDTNEVYQCARWIGHYPYIDADGEEWDHMNREQLLGFMAGSCAIACGEDNEEVAAQPGTILTYLFMANKYYRVLIIETRA